MCTSAQYATTGTGNLRNQIWWFDWAGFSITEGASRTFATNNGLNVTIKFSQTTPNEPQPSVMNTWSGAILHLLYDFTDPAIQPALFDAYSSASCSFTMSVTATRAGVPVNFSFITADAEASAYGEITTLKSSGNAWQTIDFFRNSSQTDNPLTGCGTNTVTISNTYAGAPQTGQNPVLLTYSASTTPLVVEVLLDHGGTTGGMGLAFGILEAVDRGDLPASYGTAQHQLLYGITNSCSYQPPYPSINQVETLKIGAVAGDADPIQYTDDNAIGVDEEGVTTFPVYDNSGAYTLTVNTGNTTGSNAYLTGWFDYNRNGAFDNGESVTATVPNNTTSVVLTWTGLPTYLPIGTAAGYGFRFRISSGPLAIQAATGNAVDGEVEDYFVNSIDLCTPPTVATRPDTTICAGQPVPLRATGALQYNWSTATGLSNASIADPIATPAITTTYTVTGSTPQGCQAAASLTIKVNPIPVITKSSSSAICLGSGVQLSGNSATGIGYSWSPAAGLDNPLISNPYATPLITTVYTVTVDGGNGCTNKDSVQVTINPQPSIQVRPDTTLCLLTSVPLTRQSDPADTYSWSPAAGLDDPAIANPIATPSATTLYTVTASNSYNCSVQSTVRLTVLPLPLVTKTDDTTICQGKTIRLSAGGGLSYAWTSSNNQINTTGPSLVVSPDVTTRYYVLVTDASGCSGKDSIAVDVHPLPSFSVVPPYPAICKNEDILLTATGGDGYSWTSGAGDFEGLGPSLKAQPAETREYHVKITDSICLLSGTLNVRVVVKELPTAEISKSNDINCTQGQAILQASGGVFYSWDSAIGISDLHSYNPVVTPGQTTVYHVQVTNSEGCSAHDSITVAVDFTVDPSHYPIPSAFTPNNDGNNDCWGLKYWGRVTGLDMQVFNRWGQLVFTTQNPNDCWDGTYRGTPQPPGGYIYQIRATTPCGAVYRNGILLLVR